jgi:hypothetical protein
MLNQNAVAAHQQIPLIHVVHEDDELLANSPEAEWYLILKCFLKTGSNHFKRPTEGRSRMLDYAIT